MPVIFRFSQWKMHDYGAQLVSSPRALARLLGPLCDAGVDMFHVSTRRFWEPAFPSSEKSLARWTKELTGLPVIAVGSVGLDKAHPSRALGGHDNAIAGTAGNAPAARSLERGDFALVRVGRGLFASAHWSDWKRVVWGKGVGVSEIP